MLKTSFQIPILCVIYPMRLIRFLAIAHWSVFAGRTLAKLLKRVPSNANGNIKVFNFNFPLFRVEPNAPQTLFSFFQKIGVEPEIEKKGFFKNKSIRHALRF